ncbi:MAG: DegT/DnrJ/EryC1/StrS family aminotransferase [Cyanobacteria bacterium P01_H01_bin.15]
MSSIPTSVPFVDLKFQHTPLNAAIQAAITDTIARGDFVLGHALREFERNFAAACGARQAVGVASGTAAIAIGLQAAGLEPGDEVLVPANTFIATLIGVQQAGGKPVLVDCDPDTALIDLEAAAAAVTLRTRVILPVHLYGQMVSPAALRKFAQKHQLWIFEDSAQAHLAKRDGEIAGSVGVAAGFSFYPSKNLGAFGNGGILVTQSDVIAEKARSLRNYGAPQKYLHRDLGTNSRLDTMQAAVLNVKLPHLSGWNQQRHDCASLYDRKLNQIPDGMLRPLHNASGTGHVYHLYVVRTPNETLRDRFREDLSARGIQTGIHYPIPCHLQPAYEGLGYRQGDFPVSEKLSKTILSLPLFPGLTSSQVELVCQALKSSAAEQVTFAIAP